ncbi:MAG: response regulator [Deltaproteobacteria bacterium]|nr:response regulator [Deltaproteobacteria bacterium]
MPSIRSRATDEHVDADALFAPPRDVAVLLIDDDADTRDLLAEVLEQSGYSVATACDGLEGLAALHVIRPSMILLDIEMPVMNGAQFREAQRRDPELIKIPTVVMTGSKEEPILDVGVVVALIKPFPTKVLLPLVARFCERRAS